MHDGRSIAMRSRRALMLGAALAGLAICAGGPARAQAPVDLELVLAVDASGSVDDDEFSLQLGGIAAPFRDQAVIEAIGRGLNARIAVAMVVWSEASSAKDPTAWHMVGSRAEAETFAALVERHPRRVVGGSTGIGAGIAAAISMIEQNSIAGARRVVDVSGDGIETPSELVGGTGHILVGQARLIAQGAGVTVNGLAILNEVAKLAEYYNRNVRTGAGSFVVSADDYTDFAEAMRAKLLREIDAAPAVSLNAAGRANALAAPVPAGG